MENTRAYDVIIWGASGFTGRLVAEYIYQNYGVGKSLTWAMAGRNKSKLQKVRDEVASKDVPMIIADSHDRKSLDAMTSQAKVVATTVGPYGKYGAELVASCVEHGTNYCDLAGEVVFMREMIDTHHEDAQENKVKIVHTCGFDSIPSDMGVYFMQKSVKEQTGAYAKRIDLRVKAMAGKMSGGTYASMMDTMEKAMADRSWYKTLINPYGLNPEGEQEGPDKKDLQKVVYDKIAQSWIFPFIMATINTKVVRRSNALAGYPYGKDFLYSEAMMAGDGMKGRMKAYSTAMSLGILMLARPGSFLKKMVDRVFPKPGEGPNKEERENGFYNMRLYTQLENGDYILGKVTGDRDPGYGSTSKMLAESAICLAMDDLNDTYGILTPSVAMGDHLLKRLQEKAGLTFSHE